jgi:hypothetical protein
MAAFQHTSRACLQKQAAGPYDVLPLRNLWRYHIMLFPVMSNFLFFEK